MRERERENERENERERESVRRTYTVIGVRKREGEKDIERAFRVFGESEGVAVLRKTEI